MPRQKRLHNATGSYHVMLRGDTTLLTGGTSHPFRFTGKELDRLNSLNIYDFSARWYDYADKYDFDMKSWKNPLNWGRNSETIIGEHVAGEGKPFEINIYGSKKLKSMYP
ncbi:MAG: hypothetical protein VZR53_19825 [Prevotella sp.]|nr:hypothetical protein [Prevotella sp.]